MNAPSDEIVKAAAAEIERHKYEQWTVDKAEEIARAVLATALSSQEAEIERLRPIVAEIAAFAPVWLAVARRDIIGRAIAALKDEG